MQQYHWLQCCHSTCWITVLLSTGPCAYCLFSSFGGNDRIVSLQLFSGVNNFLKKKIFCEIKTNEQNKKKGILSEGLLKSSKVESLTRPLEILIVVHILFTICASTVKAFFIEQSKYRNKIIQKEGMLVSLVKSKFWWGQFRKRKKQRLVEKKWTTVQKMAMFRFPDVLKYNCTFFFPSNGLKGRMTKVIIVEIFQIIEAVQSSVF